MAAVANTSADPRNVQRKNDKSNDLLANPRHRIIRPVSSPLNDEKETNGSESRADCVQDYSPCSCYLESYGIMVYCDGVSVETVRDVFQRVNDPEIYELDLLYPVADDETNPTISLPADFLGNTSVTRLYFFNDLATNYRNLIINPFAFSSSQNSLTSFSVSHFDFGLQKKVNFLNGFNKLEGLNFGTITNFTAFQYLPPLPSLQYFSVYNCPELNQIPFPDLSYAKLKVFDIGNKINDEMADEIVAKLAASNSADSLEQLDLSYNYLMTRIPSQVGSAFPKLKDVYLSGNNISHIPSSSLTFAYPLKLLSLGSNGLKKIETGAFEGRNVFLANKTEQ